LVCKKAQMGNRCVLWLWKRRENVLVLWFIIFKRQCIYSSLKVWKIPNYSTVQKKCKRNLPQSAKLHEFRQSNFELSFQTKMRRNFGASIVLMPAKFRKQCDESKRNFAAWEETSLGNFVPVGRNFVSLERCFASTKRNFVSRILRNELLFWRNEISLPQNEISSFMNL